MVSEMPAGAASRSYWLRTRRLGFGRWAPDDLPLAIALWSDARVTQLFGGPFNEDQVRQRLAREMSNQQALGYEYWPVFLLAGGEQVGCCGLRPYGAHGGLLEFGVHLSPDLWRQGYGQESGEAVIKYAFETLGCRGWWPGTIPKTPRLAPCFCGWDSATTSTSTTLPRA